MISYNESHNRYGKIVHRLCSILGHSHSRQLTLMLGKSPGSKGDIQVKLNLTTQVVLYTKTDSPCTAVM